MITILLIHRPMDTEGINFKRQAEVWNKLDSHYEKRIIYHFVRDQLGGEDAYFTCSKRYRISQTIDSY